MSSTLDRFYELAAYLNTLMDSDPAEAVRQAREIDLDTPERFNLMGLRAAILVDGGALARQNGFVGSLIVPDHDWIRGRDEEI